MRCCLMLSDTRLLFWQVMMQGYLPEGYLCGDLNARHDLPDDCDKSYAVGSTSHTACQLQAQLLSHLHQGQLMRWSCDALLQHVRAFEN